MNAACSEESSCVTSNMATLAKCMTSAPNAIMCGKFPLPDRAASWSQLLPSDHPAQSKLSNLTRVRAAGKSCQHTFMHGHDVYPTRAAATTVTFPPNMPIMRLGLDEETMTWFGRDCHQVHPPKNAPATDTPALPNPKSTHTHTHTTEDADDESTETNE